MKQTALKLWSLVKLALTLIAVFFFGGRAYA